MSSSLFQLHLDVDVSFDTTNQSLQLHSLRIELPEEIGLLWSDKEKKQREEVTPCKEKQQTKDDPEGTEYVEASPRYTWSDENIRGIKQEQFGELLWPVVLHKYGLSVQSSRSFSTYSSFLKSNVYRYPQRYPHQSLHGLMEWYIEEHLHILRSGKMTVAEHEAFKRRRLLRQFFLSHHLTWSPEYMEVYMEWSKGCRAEMNRYQKMEAFIKNFFDV